MVAGSEHEGGPPARHRTPVFIVTSSRPRVGKTLIARALTEYFCAQRRPVAAFDVNPGDFSLSSFLPAYAAAASIADTRGEMALFDQLVAADATAKVVDLGHGQFDRFFAVMQQIDFTDEVRRRAIDPMVLFVPDADDRARQGHAMLLHRFPALALVPVFNDAVPHLTLDRANFPPAPRGGEPVRIPALTPVVRSVIDRAGFSFVAYAGKTADTTTELHGWIRRVFLIFRDLEVRLLLGELQPTLKHSA
jgi:hypothetical protein